MRVNRNHFGRQIESFEADLNLPFLHKSPSSSGLPAASEPFKAIFIRAPIVERLLPTVTGEQQGEAEVENTVIAPARSIDTTIANDIKLADVEIMGVLPGRTAKIKTDLSNQKFDAESGDIIAVRQANVFGTSFHPELTSDPRIHIWWLEQVDLAVKSRRNP